MKLSLSSENPMGHCLTVNAVKGKGQKGAEGGASARIPQLGPG